MSYTDARLLNLKGYELLFDIEVLLREVLAQFLHDKYGSKWIKQGIPQDIKVKVTESREIERKTPWVKLTPHHPLYYIDFPDLKKIINLNIGEFASVFSTKIAVETLISDLEPIRNRIAHNRLISRGDLMVLEGCHQKIIGAIPDHQLKLAREAVQRKVSISESLLILQTFILSSIEFLQKSDPLPPESLSKLEMLKEWWFDEEFLGCSLVCISEFIESCRVYAALPRGLGQGIVRRQQIDSGNLLELGLASAAAIGDLTASIGKSYA